MTKKTKRNVIISASSTIAVCLGLIAGGTYAWFTDKADVSVNKVVSGTLDVTMKMRNNPDEEWVDAEGQTLHFLRAGDDRKLVDTENDDPVLWEPGATYKLPQLQIVNQGSLAFQYKVVLGGATGDTAILDVIRFKSVATKEDGTTSSVSNALGAEVIYEGSILPGKTYESISISATMSEFAGNEYQGLEVNDIAVTVYATQVPYETDSNGSDYDKEAGFFNFSGTTGEVTSNMTSSGHNGVVFADKGAQVTINANLTAKESSDRYAMGVWADGKDTKVTIDGGNFTQIITGTDSQYDMIYASAGATIEITGGTFKSATPKWTLNCQNSSGSKIIVSGGRYYKFNPAKQEKGAFTPGTQEIFVKDGYIVTQDGDWYEVKKISDETLADSILPVNMKTPAAGETLGAAVAATIKEVFAEDSALKSAKGVSLTLPAGEVKLNETGTTSTIEAATKDKEVVLSGAGKDKTNYVNLKSSGSGEGGSDYSFQQAKAVTFKNMTLNFGTGTYNGIVRAGDVHFENCKLIGMGSYWGVGEVTFTDCEFESSDYCLWLYSGASFTFDNCTFKSETGKFINAYKEQAVSETVNVTMNKCTFITDSPNKAAVCLKSYCNVAWNLTFTNCDATACKADGDASDLATGSKYYSVRSSDNGNVCPADTTVTIDGAVVWANGAKA